MLLQKYLFLYTLAAILDFAILDHFLDPLKKCNPFFSWSSWYFESESSEKSILTDKMQERVMWHTYEPTLKF